MLFWQLRLAYSDQRDEIIFLQMQLEAKDAKIKQLEKEKESLLREKSQRWMEFAWILLLPYIYVQNSQLLVYL